MGKEFVSIHNKKMKRYEKKLGPIGAFLLRRKGRKDMRNGLVHVGVDDMNAPLSPFLEKDDATFGQVVFSAWELTHSIVKGLYKELEKAIKMQREYEKELEIISSKEPKTLDETQMSKRKQGEENLSEDQVKKRRQNEEEKRNSGYRASKSAATQRARENIENIEELRSKVVEENTSCRLFCSVVRHYFEQRRAAYRDGVLKEWQDEKAMPYNPPSLPRKEDDAERVYCAAHESTMDEALRRIERYKKLESVEKLMDEEYTKEV